jgi:hypothetical protein
MAGYLDKRDYIGVLGVSYFLKAVFQKIKKIKFIIVINEPELLTANAGAMIDTLRCFTEMFKIK